jgi:hypothetical protein
MSRLRMMQVWTAMVVLSTGLTVVPGVTAGSPPTFTGKVSDAMCGAQTLGGEPRPRSLRSGLRAKGRKLCSGSRRQGVYPGNDPYLSKRFRPGTVPRLMFQAPFKSVRANPDRTELPPAAFSITFMRCSSF